ncbi:MAG: metallophosphoesterase [Cyanobacteria bacterium J06649_4]
MSQLFSQTADKRLAQQVKWRHQSVLDSSVDQTRLAIADAPTQPLPFSFLVMGDTDSGELYPALSGPKTAASDFLEYFSQQVVAQQQDSRFCLHTGDVTYPTGSFENYLSGFLRPYRALLSQLPQSPDYSSSDVVFRRPMLPVPGNHDYADVPWLKQCWQWLQRLSAQALRKLFNTSMGPYGGQGGEGYGQTFLDDLSKLSSAQLSAYLVQNYSGSVDAPDATAKYCLSYRPGQFTRLPNRYYSFSYGGIDFFALDSNTWNMPPESPGFDHEQLAWLEQSLLQSWKNPKTLGRIIYLHHSPYTSEVSRSQQSSTLWVRRHLRQVFDQVALSLELDDCAQKEARKKEKGYSGSPNRSFALVDLVIGGHAHCLEYLKTEDTGHCDRNTDWLVCGGSGTSLRRQRGSNRQILENINEQGRRQTRLVAQSQLYAGVHGKGQRKKIFHSFVRIDIDPDSDTLITICPFVVNYVQGSWQTQELAPIAIESSALNKRLNQKMTAIA